MKRTILNSLWLGLSLVSFLVAFVFLTSVTESNFQTTISWAVGFLGLAILAFFIWLMIVVSHFYKNINIKENQNT